MIALSTYIRLGEHLAADYTNSKIAKIFRGEGTGGNKWLGRMGVEIGHAPSWEV